jgi:hypothetical protein
MWWGVRTDFGAVARARPRAGPTASAHRREARRSARAATGVECDADRQSKSPTRGMIALCYSGTLAQVVKFSICGGARHRLHAHQWGWA